MTEKPAANPSRTGENSGLHYRGRGQPGVLSLRPVDPGAISTTRSGK